MRQDHIFDGIIHLTKKLKYIDFPSKSIPQKWYLLALINSVQKNKLFFLECSWRRRLWRRSFASFFQIFKTSLYFYLSVGTTWRIFTPTYAHFWFDIFTISHQYPTFAPLIEIMIYVEFFRMACHNFPPYCNCLFQLNVESTNTLTRSTLMWPWKNDFKWAQARVVIELLARGMVKAIAWLVIVVILFSSATHFLRV